jgi:hypothetical protein
LYAIYKIKPKLLTGKNNILKPTKVTSATTTIRVTLQLCQEDLIFFTARKKIRRKSATEKAKGKETERTASTSTASNSSVTATVV